jgi:hypothetical protein
MLWSRLLLHLTGSVNEDLVFQNQMLTVQVRELQRLVNGRPWYSLSFKMQVARLGRMLTPESLAKACVVIRPSTVLGWYRQLFKRKHDHSDKLQHKLQPSRPRISAALEHRIVQFALENPRWGPKRIVGMPHVILLGERSLRRAVSQYVEHHNTERPHQGKDNQALTALNNPDSVDNDRQHNTENTEANEDIGDLVIE